MNDNMTALVPLAETMELGQILAKSRFFADATEAAQAVVKVLAGREIGAGPIASMVGIHIIKGKPAIGATLMAGVIRNSKRYDYRIRKHDDTLCEIEFFMRNGSQLESLGVSAFSIEDAKRAGTQNIDKFPRNMLFARAMSNGAKWFCPDIFGGAPVYTPEELGASVDGDGDVIEGSVRVVQPEPQTQPTVTQAAPPTKPNGTRHTPQPPTDEKADAMFEQMPSAQAERQPAPAKTNGDGKLKPAGLEVEFDAIPTAQQERAAASPVANADGYQPTCPVCDGLMWDNREGKRNPKAPDFKCKDKECNGAIWLPETPEKGRAAMFANVKAIYGDNTDEFKTWLQERYHVASSKELTLNQLAEVVARLKQQQPA